VGPSTSNRSFQTSFLEVEASSTMMKGAYASPPLEPEMPTPVAIQSENAGQYCCISRPPKLIQQSSRLQTPLPPEINATPMQHDVAIVPPSRSLRSSASAHHAASLTVSGGQASSSATIAAEKLFPTMIYHLSLSKMHVEEISATISATISCTLDEPSTLGRRMSLPLRVESANRFVASI